MGQNTPLLQLMHDAVGPANRIKKLAEMIINGPPKDTIELTKMIIKSSDDINIALDNYYTKTK